MALSPLSFRAALTNPDFRATQQAYEKARLMEDPAFTELAQKTGLLSAQTAVMQYGDKALQANFLNSTIVAPDESKVAEARANISAAIQNFNPHLSGEQLSVFSGKIMGMMNTVQLADAARSPANASQVIATVTAAANAESKALMTGIVTANMVASADATIEGGRKTSLLAMSALMDDMKDPSRNGSRYDQLGSASASTSGTSYYSTPAGMNEMRQLAVSQGVAWVANNPDMLRLGPEVIKAIAKTGMQQDNFKHLTDAGFKAKDIGTMARAVQTLDMPKQDNQKLYNGVADTFGGDSKDDKQRRNRVNGLLDDTVKNPHNRDKNFQQIGDIADQAVRDHPDDPKVKKGAQTINTLVDKYTDAKEAKLEAKEGKLDAKEDKLEAKTEKTAQVEATVKAKNQVANKLDSMDDLTGDLAEAPKVKTAAVVAEKTDAVGKETKSAEAKNDAPKPKEQVAAVKKPPLNPTV